MNDPKRGRLMDSEEDIENIVKKASTDDKLLSDLLQGVISKNDEIRSKNYEIILYISKKHPKILYSKWNFLAELLTSDNHFHRYIAINLLSNLASVDTNNNFEDLFDRYFSNIKSNRTMVAGQTALNSGKIAKEKQNLRQKITNILLNIDKIHQGKHTELLKGYAIDAFNDYFKETNDKKEILKFVKKQLNSDSPKTKKAAKDFLKKWNR
jgi:hypothetical protein